MKEQRSVEPTQLHCACPAHVPLESFSGVCVSFVKLSDGVKQQLKLALKLLGGKRAPTWDQCTHVVAEVVSSDMENEVGARLTSGAMKAVTPAWLFESLALGRRAPESKFSTWTCRCDVDLEEPAASRPVNPDVADVLKGVRLHVPPQVHAAQPEVTRLCKDLGATVCVDSRDCLVVGQANAPVKWLLECHRQGRRIELSEIEQQEAEQVARGGKRVRDIEWDSSAMDELQGLVNGSRRRSSGGGGAAAPEKRRRTSASKKPAKGKE